MTGDVFHRMAFVERKCGFDDSRRQLRKPSANRDAFPGNAVFTDNISFQVHQFANANANAVDAFRLNFPGVPVYHGDIANLSVEQALEMTGLQPGELDVFDGSPPCQGFSVAGKRKALDPRNSLIFEFGRLVVELAAATFVMENFLAAMRRAYSCSRQAELHGGGALSSISIPAGVGPWRSTKCSVFINSLKHISLIIL